MTDEQKAAQVAGWQVVCKAHNTARKHQWQEPYASRYHEALAAYNKAEQDRESVYVQT